jgi:cell division protein FtsQ
MDRSRRQGAKEAVPPPPAASRLTLKPRRNRRRPSSIWTRVPKPAQIVDACGRAVRRSLPAIIGGAVLAVLGGSGWLGYRWITTTPRFAITEISVRGANHLTPDEIRAALPVHEGDNVFATDLGAVSRALHANPWIADADVARVLPHTLAIEVHERTPVALAELGGLYLVGADGQPFKRASDDEAKDLPVITGLDRAAYLADPSATAAQIRGALAALAAWSAVADRPAIAELHLDARGALSLRTIDRDTAIELGAMDADLASRMETFDAAWSELADGERARARAVHLSAHSDHVTVAFKDQ